MESTRSPIVPTCDDPKCAFPPDMAPGNQFSAMAGTKDLPKFVDPYSSSVGVLGESRLVIDDEPEEYARLRRGNEGFGP